MEKEVIISAKHLKKVFGSGESEQVIYSDFDIDIYKGDFRLSWERRAQESQR